MGEKVERKSKPSRIEFNREFQGNHGMIYYFDIEFEDETVGQFSSAKREQAKFSIGKEVTYSCEATSNARGPYNKIDVVKPPKEQERRGGSGSHQLSPEVEASITASVCLDQAAVVISKTGMHEQVKPDLVALHVLANKFYDYIMEKSKGDRQLSINYQSRLKEVTNYLMDWPSLNIKSSDEILKYVELEVAYLKMKIEKK